MVSQGRSGWECGGEAGSVEVRQGVACNGKQWEGLGNWA